MFRNELKNETLNKQTLFPVGSLIECLIMNIENRLKKKQVRSAQMQTNFLWPTQLKSHKVVFYSETELTLKFQPYIMFWGANPNLPAIPPYSVALHTNTLQYSALDEKSVVTPDTPDIWLP